MERSGGFNVLESRLVGERERSKWRGWRGIYTPTPESDRCVFSGGSRIIRGNLGSSGVLTEKAKHTLNFLGPDHPVSGRIIQPGLYQELTNHQVRIIRPRAGSSGLTPNRRALFGRIIRPSAEFFVVKCFVSDFSQKSHLKWSILATWNSFECVPLDSTVDPILKFKPKNKIKCRSNPPSDF